jgi:3-dehydroquinate synthetase
MNTLVVDLGDRSYPIKIGRQLFTNPALLTEHIHGRQVMIVSNTTVAPLYLDAVTGMLADFHYKSVILPDGEEYKTLDTLNTIFTALLENRFNRGCTLIALGGGSSATSPVLQPPVTSAALHLCRFRPPCWRRSIHRSAAKPASITRWGKT